MRVLDSRGSRPANHDITGSDGVREVPGVAHFCWTERGPFAGRGIVVQPTSVAYEGWVGFSGSENSAPQPIVPEDGGGERGDVEILKGVGVSSPAWLNFAGWVKEDTRAAPFWPSPKGEEVRLADVNPFGAGRVPVLHPVDDMSRASGVQGVPPACTKKRAGGVSAVVGVAVPPCCPALVLDGVEFTDCPGGAAIPRGIP